MKAAYVVNGSDPSQLSRSSCYLIWKHRIICRLQQRRPQLRRRRVQSKANAKLESDVRGRKSDVVPLMPAALKAFRGAVASQGTASARTLCFPIVSLSLDPLCPNLAYWLGLFCGKWVMHTQPGDARGSSDQGVDKPGGSALPTACTQKWTV